MPDHQGQPGTVGGSMTTAVVEQPPLQLILRLSTKKPAEQDKTDNCKPHVTWHPDTVDNEHLGRLKSNCCCIWVKSHKWDDPTTWEQDECEFQTEYCRGHTLPTRPHPDSGKEKKNPDDWTSHPSTA